MSQACTSTPTPATWPGSEEEKGPDRCGDVWRLESEITDEKFTFKIFPGLTLVRPPA